jgi:hypothetical protein
MSTSTTSIIPLSIAGPDDTFGPETERRLSQLETLVVTVLHSPLSAAMTPEDAVTFRRQIIDEVIEIARRADEWQLVAPARGLLRRRNAPSEFDQLLDGSDRWRHRAEALGEEHAFDRSEELARAGLKLAGGDRRQEWRALHLIAMAQMTRMAHLPDLLLLQTFVGSARRARDAVVDVALSVQADMSLALLMTLSTNSAAALETAERLRNKRTLARAINAIAATEAIAVEAGVAVPTEGAVEYGDGMSLSLAVGQELAQSRLAELQHGLTEDGGTTHLDHALRRSHRAFDVGLEHGYAQGIAAAAATWGRQAFARWRAGGPEGAGDELRNVLTQGILYCVPGSGVCLELLALWGEMFYAYGAQHDLESERLVADLIYSTCCDDLAPRDAVGHRELARRWANLAGHADEGDEVARGAWEHTLRAQRRVVQDAGVEGLRLIAVDGGGPVHQLAAAAFATAGDGVRAVEITEMGRSVSLQRSVISNTEALEQLRARGSAAIVDAYLDASEQEHAAQEALRAWDRPEIDDDEVEEFHVVMERVVEAVRLRRAAEKRVKVAAGDDDFPRPLRFAQLREAAADSPLVYIVAGLRTGFLMIVRDTGATAPELVPLPLLTQRELGLHAWEHVKLYRGWQPDSDSWPEQLEAGGSWLWDAVVGPLLDATGGGLVRVVPLGLLMALPLQAAWTTDGAGRRISTIDRLTLSYLPSAAAFRIARSRPTADGWNALLVDDPAGDLESSSEEGRAVRRRFGNDLRELPGAAATIDAVRDALTAHNFAHISAHGYIRESLPRFSAIVLADGDLRLDDLRRADLRELETLILSSCDSAMTGGRSLDEGLSFPGLMYGLSARAVIGAHWAVDQFATGRLFERFYAHWDLSHDPRATAEALRLAQVDLRDSDSRLAHPVWWGGFMHVG